VARTLPVWADVARIDVDHDNRLQKALRRPPARRQRQHRGITAADVDSVAPDCPQTARRPAQADACYRQPVTAAALESERAAGVGRAGGEVA
jgi:hypothetical protein